MISNELWEEKSSRVKKKTNMSHLIIVIEVSSTKYKRRQNRERDKGFNYFRERERDYYNKSGELQRHSDGQTVGRFFRTERSEVCFSSQHTDWFVMEGIFFFSPSFDFHFDWVLLLEEPNWPSFSLLKFRRIFYQCFWVLFDSILQCIVSEFPTQLETRTIWLIWS